MSFTGIIKGNSIKFDKPLPYKNGEMVQIEIISIKELKKGSPKAILKNVGKISIKDAKIVQEGAESCRKIDEEMWKEMAN